MSNAKPVKWQSDTIIFTYDNSQTRVNDKIWILRVRVYNLVSSFYYAKLHSRLTVFESGNFESKPRHALGKIMLNTRPDCSAKFSNLRFSNASAIMCNLDALLFACTFLTVSILNVKTAELKALSELRKIIYDRTNGPIPCAWNH